MNAWVHAQFGVTDFWTFVVGTVLIVLLPGPSLEDAYPVAFKHIKSAEASA